MNERMIGYLPNYYADVHEAKELIGAEAATIGQLSADIDDALAQFSVETATWGLANWERLVGVATDVSKPIDQRRSVVASKLRGIGTVTVALIKSVAESYANGEVEVIEDAPAYKICVKFVGKLGVPPNLPDIEQALRDIIPAHLAINYEFMYVLYSQVKSTYADYGALKATGKTYSQILNGQ